jgi:hypothetical protein
MKHESLHSFADLDKAKFPTKADPSAKHSSLTPSPSQGDSLPRPSVPRGAGPVAPSPDNEALLKTQETLLSERHKLEQWKHELEEKAGDIKSREDLLRSQRTKLDQDRVVAESDAARKQAALAARASQLTQLEQDLDQQKKNNYRRKVELDAQSISLDSRQEKIYVEEKALEERVCDVANREAACAGITRESEALKSENSELGILVEKQEAKIQILREKSRQLRDKLDAANRSLDEISQSFDKAKRDHRAEIRILDKELVRKNSEINSLFTIRDKYNDIASDLNKAKKEIRDLKASLAVAATHANAYEVLRAKYDGVCSDLKEAKREIRNINASLVVAESRTTNPDDLLDIQGQFYLTHPGIIDWLASEWADGPFSMPNHVTVLGEGPIDTNQWLSQLEGWECQAWQNGNEWIIIGREGWNPEDIDAIVAERVDQSIRIVSQEMFLAAMISGHDPFDAAEDILFAFAEGHPALEYLIESGFEWPFFYGGTLLVDPPPPPEGVEKSPVKLMGYTVGMNGLSEKRRRKILENAYLGEIPWVDPPSYMHEWGRARTRRRLWRMAHHLVWLIRKASGKDNMDEAISDWKSDLDWLYYRFYNDGGMDFNWPDTSV